MGNSHPDLSYAAHTPPLYGRGHTPPLQGSGHTPPLITQDTTHRNDFRFELLGLVLISDKIPSFNIYIFMVEIKNLKFVWWL